MTTVERIDQIVFTDDFFRSSDNTLQSHPSNRRFLFRTLGLRLGICCKEMSARSDGGELDVAAMMSALALPRDLRGWARTALADLRPLAEAGLIPRFGSTTLVIGWGMPPSLMRYVDGCGASFIDLEIAPLRFGAHLSFCARSNNRRIEQVLEGWRIHDEAFWNEAVVLKGYFARRGSSDIFDRRLSVGLFCGQTRVDLALVQNGEIARPEDSLEQVRRLAREVDILAIKPHPHEESVRHLEHFAANIPNAAWTDANIYALLSSNNLSFVCGLSSGALLEADYFMKRSFRLITQDRNNRTQLPAGCSDWIPIGTDILSLQGIAKVCSAPCHATGHISKVPQDALDRAFGMRWGLDTNSPGLNSLPQASPGRGYDICAGHDNIAWLSFGWSSPEVTGVWTTGEHACIVIPLPAGAFEDDETISVTLHGKLFAASSARAPRIHAWLNGERTNALLHEAPAQADDMRFELSLHPEAGQPVKALVIELDIAGPLRPCDVGPSDDTRRLGFHLQRLSVHEAHATMPRNAPPTRPSRPEQVPKETAARGWAVAVACVILAAAAVFYGNSPVAPREETHASGWIELKHSVSTGIDILRGDLQALLRQHHV